MDTAAPAVQHALELRPPPGVSLEPVPGGVQLVLVDGSEKFVPTHDPDPKDRGLALELVPKPMQGAFPGTGVRPGAGWRRRKPREEGEAGVPELEPEQLSWSWWRLDAQRTRGHAWTDDDDRVLAELELRTWNAVDVGQRHSVERPGWFVGIVPRPLVALVMLVWAAYVAGAFGVKVTGPQLAAELQVSDRHARRWRRLAQRLGLIRAIATWVEKTDGNGWEQGITVYRLGFALELLAGLSAFERGKVPRRKGISRKAARKHGAGLRRASRAFKRAREGNLWRALPRNANRKRRATSSAPRRGLQSRAPAQRERLPSPGRPHRLPAPHDLGKLVPEERPPGAFVEPGTDILSTHPAPPPKGGRGDARGKAGASPGTPIERARFAREISPGHGARANDGASPVRANVPAALGRGFEGHGAASSSSPPAKPTRTTGDDARAEIVRMLEGVGGSPFARKLAARLELEPAAARAYDRADDDGRRRLLELQGRQRDAQGDGSAAEQGTFPEWDWELPGGGGNVDGEP